MKTYIKILLGLTIGFVSCKKDFLERVPVTNLSDANFWQTSSDLQLYINNLYNRTDLLPNYNSWFNQGIYSLDATNGSDTYIQVDYNRRMNGELVLPSSGGGWSASDWEALRDINYFLDHFVSVDAPWEDIKQYVGEALFFRALFYFNKLKSFGDLPWASSVVQSNSEILFGARLPRNQIADSILNDLELSIEYLPGFNGVWTGRLTKEAAMALQARIALYEGTWERYHMLKNTKFKVGDSDGVAFIQKAADVAGDLIAMSNTNGYPALDNYGEQNGYWDLFNQKDYSNSKEILFWRKYSAELGQYNKWVLYTSVGGSFGVTKNMVDSYLCEDGKPISISPLYQGDHSLKSVVKNRDPRLNQTIQVDDGKHFIWKNPVLYFETPTFEGSPESNCPTGYQLYKGHTADFSEDVSGMGTSGLIYFRYAEVLLIYAEARAELGIITQSDLDNTINKLRLRVGMASGLLNINDIAIDKDWEFEGISPLLQEIRRERKIELVCEGFRVDDIFRWAAADELIVNKKVLGGFQQQWINYPNASTEFLTAADHLQVNDQGYIEPFKNLLDDGFHFDLGRDYLLPIPTSEGVLNNNLGQNPGW